MAKRGTLTAARRAGVRMRSASKAMSPAEKALYHAELGAGKRRVKRDFFGLTDSELDELRGLVRAHLQTVAR